jgi:hypothetical protein
VTSHRKHSIWAAVLFTAVLAFAILLLLLGLLPWSPVNCWHYDVDIHSGRIRYIRVIAFLPIQKRIDPSALSNALHPEDVRGSEPDWRRALTLSPGIHHSPHYIFHSAISQIRELEIDWQLGDFTPAARRASAKRVLQLWQHGQRDDEAKPYLRALADVAIQMSSEHKGTDEKDLPKGQ